MSLNDLSEQLEISKTTANRIVTLSVNEGFLSNEAHKLIGNPRAII